MSATTSPGPSLGTRVGAYLIDYLLGLAVGLVALRLVGTGRLVLTVGGAAIALGYALWYLSWLGSSGRTPGKRALNIRVVDGTSDQPIGLGRAFVRQLVVGVLGPVNLVQLLTIPKSPRRQGWHDRAVGSVVVVAPAGAAAVAPAVVTPSGLRPTGPPLPSVPAPTGMVPPPPGMVPPPPGTVTTGVDHDPIAAPPVLPAPVPPAPVPPAPVPPASVPAAPVDATPVSGAPLLPAPAPGEEGRDTDRTAVVPRRRRSGFVLHTDAGAARVVDGLLLLGRDPDVSLVSGSTAWVLEDPGLTVSKTHALVGTDDGSIWLEDWHSTNGVLVRRGGEAIELDPHRRAPLQLGDQIELGEFVLTVKEIA